MWKTIACSKSELKLSTTLACGQSFRWKEHKPGEWIGVLAGRVFLLSQDEDHLFYQTFHKPTTEAQHLKASGDMQESVSRKKVAKFKKNDKKTPPANEGVTSEEQTILNDYFQLNVSLVELYKSWSKWDSNFEKVACKFDGIRMLRQDPVENLFSFICSSNNHISRISNMVEKLCENYGEKVTDIDGQSFHSFPKIKPLASEGVEQELRALGFGYRAKYINETAKYIMRNHDEGWLESLRTIPYKDTKKELIKLCGVGPKVADCVCLMSLDKSGAVPVDTHVWQIAARDYMPKLKQAKSLTDKLYEEIGDHFRGIWGDYAGWAHSVLFTADLKQFKQSEAKTEKKKDRSSKRSMDCTKDTKTKSVKRGR